MRQASKRIPESAEKTVRDIRRATRRHHSAEEKIHPPELRSHPPGGAVRPFSNGGKRSNEKPSSKDAACISWQSQPEPSNQMSQTFS
jgi:hypothetical protein